jgi:hypothetical protein
MLFEGECTAHLLHSILISRYNGRYGGHLTYEVGEGGRSDLEVRGQSEVVEDLAREQRQLRRLRHVPRRLVQR